MLKNNKHISLISIPMKGISLYILLIALLFNPLVAQEDWTMELVVPISNPAGERIISLDRYPRLHVLLKNVSGETQKLWKDWNTWGYFNLSFIWEIEGKAHEIRKKTPQAWDGDFPDFWIIPAGETLVLEVDMSTGEWEGIPDLYGEQIKASLVGSYENKPDGLGRKFGIWMGKIKSNEIEIIFK